MQFLNRKYYPTKYIPDHPKADPNGSVREHILFAETILSKPLPSRAVIHHVNGDISTHRKNIVICQDHSYHGLLHARMKSLKACGHANWRKCVHCKKYDDPENLYITPNGKQAYHRECGNKHHREYMTKKRLLNPKPPRKYDNRDPITGKFINSKKEK